MSSFEARDSAMAILAQRTQARRREAVVRAVAAIQAKHGATEDDLVEGIHELKRRGVI